jgi:anti-anti-sigma factor
MNKTLKITKEPVQEKEHIIVMHLDGSLDANGEETLLTVAREVYDEGGRFLLLDLAEVDILTSAGMRAMHKVYKMFTPAEERFKVGHVKLCRAPQQMYQSLGVTGFLQTIPSYETLEDAIVSF